MQTLHISIAASGFDAGYKWAILTATPRQLHALAHCGKIRDGLALARIVLFNARTNMHTARAFWDGYWPKHLFGIVSVHAPAFCEGFTRGAMTYYDTLLKRFRGPGPFKPTSEDLRGILSHYADDDWPDVLQALRRHFPHWFEDREYDRECDREAA